MSNFPDFPSSDHSSSRDDPERIRKYSRVGTPRPNTPEVSPQQQQTVNNTYSRDLMSWHTHSNNKQDPGLNPDKERNPMSDTEVVDDCSSLYPSKEKAEQVKEKKMEKEENGHQGIFHPPSHAFHL